jgi:phage terminase small subunit
MAYLSLETGVPSKGKGAKLSKKMELFVSEYLVDLNATQAITRAGYKTNNPNRLGSELLRHPLVKATIDAALSKRLQNNEVKADYLINKLINIIETTETANPQACLRAIELAGKSIALWKDRQEITGADGGAIQTEQTQRNVDDFKSKLARLARREGEGSVVEFPNPIGNTKS